MSDNREGRNAILGVVTDTICEVVFVRSATEGHVPSKVVGGVSSIGTRTTGCVGGDVVVCFLPREEPDVSS